MLAADASQESILSVWQWQWGHLLGKVAVSRRERININLMKLTWNFYMLRRCKKDYMAPRFIH